MKKTCFILVTVAAAASAQTPQSTGVVYQQAGVMSFQELGPRIMLGGPEIRDITGSPYAATQQSHSLQVLGDGTRIERTETQQLYRDSQGRTRTESQESGTVIIQDPVAGFNVILNPSTKTARKINTPTAIKNPGMGEVKTLIAAQARLDGAALTGGGIASAGASAGATGIVIARSDGAASGTAAKPNVEDLPAQNLNGVLATGRRTTLTIPVGQIGNDRPIEVISETWFSSDLQMVVKSSNSDPRFGDASMELTNIVRSEPDPSLFQIPADYTVTEPKALMHSTPMQPKE